MVTIHRSRVQMHTAVNNNKRKPKTHFTGQKPEKPLPIDRKLLSSAKVTVAATHKAKGSAVHTATVLQDSDCEDSPHGDVHKDVDEGVPTFSKKRVASTEEIASSGRRRSMLRAAVAASHGSSVAADSDDEEWSDSPWASLILELPVDVHGEHLPREEDRLPTPATLPEPVSITSPRNWQQTLVFLFAGRKKTVEIDKGKQRMVDTPTTPSVETENTQPPAEGIPREDSARPATPPSSPPPPKLTLRQAIPSVQPASAAQDPARKPGYRHVAESEIMNFYKGYAVLAKDNFEPESVQRGFKVPNSLASSLSAPSLEQRRNQSEGALFNRKGDKWAQWHTKYAKVESNPFSRTNSAVELAQLNTSDTRTDRKGSAAASTRSSDSSGGCQLVITKEEYLSKNGVCWLK